MLPKNTEQECSLLKQRHVVFVSLLGHLDNFIVFLIETVAQF